MTRAKLPSYMLNGKSGWMFGAQINHEPVDSVLLANCALPPVVSGCEVFLVNWFSKPEFASIN
jgi:hypothetical protein